MYNKYNNVFDDHDEDDNVADGAVVDDDVEDDEVQEDDVEDDEVQEDDVKDDEVEVDEDEVENAEDEVEDDVVEKKEDGDVEGDNDEEDDEKDDNFDVAEDEVEVDDVKDHEAKEEDYDDDDDDDDDDVKNDDVERRKITMLRRRTDSKTGTHMHLNISQEPLRARIYRLNAADHDQPRRRLCASLRSRHALRHCTRAILCKNLQEKCIGPRSRPTLCASPRSRHALWTFHKSHFMGEFTGKMPQTKIADETLWGPAAFQKSRCAREFSGKLPGPTIAKPVQSKPAQSKCISTLHKSLFMRNLQEKSPGPGGAPWSSTGLYSYRKNPSLWTQCLGKKCKINYPGKRP